MGAYSVTGADRINETMKDTWGHFYPEGGSKHYGEMVIAYCEYGDLVIIKTDFPGLCCSPQRHALEQTIWDRINTSDLDIGIYKVSCGLWFYKDCDDVMRSNIGTLINIKIENMEVI